jgi:hypothetical protein
METRLTEFSYGYCITEEFANGMGPGLKAAPYFPSLYIEGKAGGGFDVLIGSALFLQFKLCEEFTTPRALECKKKLLNPPLYRFYLHRRDHSDQHQLLMELEKAGNQVYYIAPGFADVDSLNRHYVRRQVTSNSAMFSPSDIGPLPDNKLHRIAFRPDDKFGWFLSDPRQIPMQRSEGVRNRTREQERARNGRDVREWAFTLVQKIESILGERYGRSWPTNEVGAIEQNADEPLQRAAYLARTYFGAEMFVGTR